MRIQILLAGAAMAVMASVSAVSANAAVTQIATQGAFTAAGTITQNTNFDAYGPGANFPGNGLVAGDLRFFEGGQNLIGLMEPGSFGYNTARNLLTDNAIRGTTIQIAGLHNLFAFNLGNFFSSGAANLALVTNIGNYAFSPTVNSAQNLGALTFVGFQAGAGEHFTSVNYSGGNATGATDIQLGTSGAVPEPTTWALMLTGFLGAGVALRSNRRRQVALAA